METTKRTECKRLGRDNLIDRVAIDLRKSTSSARGRHERLLKNDIHKTTVKLL